MRQLSLLLAVVFVVAACGGNDVSDDRPTIVIHTAAGQRELTVEIADTNEERARGLMGRTALPDDAGMLFVYPTVTQGGYWMKNTLIPLSIAFYDADGTIVRILDMEPCKRDPCPVYDPGVPYAGALEVNEGTFARLGVREGDRIELET